MTDNHSIRTVLLVAVCFLLAACGTKHVAVDKSRQPAVAPSQTDGKQPAATETERKKSKNTDNLWQGIEYDGQPWVRNISIPYSIPQGLYNRHITLWPSHGRYYDQEKLQWKWQRPFLFGTTEDLFTQTIVVPFLLPMLEKAGANVFVPRERDWQRHEVIVDNDGDRDGYAELSSQQGRWEDAGTRGFAFHTGRYHDGENPFEAGTARMAQAAKTPTSTITYQPSLPEAGRYAVYVSYPDRDNTVDDAHYTVYHQGQATQFLVNQQMGGGTWVYLGTFEFEKGNSERNRVVLSNESAHKGVVVADAVRFGGGMGNIERGDTISGMPRSFEGARYYAQWAGAPYYIYSTKAGADDYRDDINARSYMSNWLSGGSCYVPDSAGLRVPIELSVAVHSDAGFHDDYTSVYGSLGVCTTNSSNGILPSGISREASKTLMNMALGSIQNDLTHYLGSWPVRELRDANYSETRCPYAPSTIIETLSHQSFPDMMLAQDPKFRFILARSIYKSILKFTAQAHSKSYVVAPLPPKGLSVEFQNNNIVRIAWQATTDELEPSAAPDEYIVYTSAGTGSFDNGTLIKGTSCKMSLQPGVVYNFRVAAVNKGGESFPSETVSALYHPGATHSMMIVNGFHRVGAPAARQTETEQGFDFDIDPGIGYGTTAGWSGTQRCFDKQKIGIEGPGGLGYSGQEWQGSFIAGNDFNYTYTHTEAMKNLLHFNVASCSSEVVEKGDIDLQKYHVVDVILGLEKDDGNALLPYKTFSRKMQERLTRYAHSGGALMVSGAYVGSDMRHSADSAFVANILKLKAAGATRIYADSTVTGLGTDMVFHRTLNEDHYAATATDILKPLEPAFSAMVYASGNSAAVAYNGRDYRSFTMGFPFECITSYRKRAAIMKGIVNFLCPQ